MLTPVDIENKEFTKAFRGYDIYEVEEFMKNLVADYEKMYRENAELKEKNAMLGEAIGNYKGMEETMQNAILVAQRTAEDIKQNAYERSENILKDAQRRAAEAINNANRSIRDLEKTYLGMQGEMNGFRAKMNSLLSTYMQLLSELPEQTAPKGHAFDQVQMSLGQEEPLIRSGEIADNTAEQENTNTFTLPSLIREPEEAKPQEKKEEPMAKMPDPVKVQEVHSEPERKAAIPLRQTTGLDIDRKINPVVEELLRKKREQSGLPVLEKEAPVEVATPVGNEVPAAEPVESFSAPIVEPEPAPTAKEPEPFSFTKETLKRETGGSAMIDLENLQDFDVFSDDSL